MERKIERERERDKEKGRKREREKRLEQSHLHTADEIFLSFQVFPFRAASLAVEVLVARRRRGAMPAVRQARGVWALPEGTLFSFSYHFFSLFFTTTKY